MLFRSKPEAAATILGVCPPTPGNDGHLVGILGAVHEYLHTTQMAFKPGTPEGFDLIPCFMREGEPEWGKAASVYDFSDYVLNLIYPPFLRNGDQNLPQITPREWTAEEVSSYLIQSADFKNCYQNPNYALSYSLGALAIEALVSIGGSESFWALHERLVDHQDLNSAFKDIYGITWDEAVPILSEVVAKKVTLAIPIFAAQKQVNDLKKP